MDRVIREAVLPACFGQVEGLEEVCRLVGYDPAQQALLAKYAGALTGLIQGFGQRYFGQLLESHQAAQALLPHLGSRLCLLSDQQQKHHHDLACLPLDEAQALRARQLGEMHARIGLDPAYLAGLGELHVQAFSAAIACLSLDAAEQARLLQSVRKRVGADMVLQLSGALALQSPARVQSADLFQLEQFSRLLLGLSHREASSLAASALPQYLIELCGQHGFTDASLYGLPNGQLLAGKRSTAVDSALSHIILETLSGSHQPCACRACYPALITVPLIGSGKPLALLVLATKETGNLPPSVCDMLAAIGREAARLLLAAAGQAKLTPAEQELAYLSRHDSLTGLSNRTHLLTLLDSMPAGERWVAVLAIDGFHEINARLGHDFGDRVLLSCASRITPMLPSGSGVGRVGAARFLLYGHGAEAQLDSLIAAIVHVLEQPIDLGSEHVQIKLSGGVVMDESGHCQGATLLRRADLALIRARHKGNSHWHYYDAAMDEEIRQLHRLRTEFAQALAQDELALFFQPKINLHTHAVIGVEVLVRWRKDGRYIAPGQFFPAIEATDLMRQLDSWVLKETLRHLVNWQRQLRALPVSVNLSAMSLKHEDFLPMVERLLAQYPQVACLLEIEVLETLSQQEALQIAHKLEHCRTLGIRIALDDFGTGASSLVHLQQLPFDTIKIDQRFVRKMIEFPDNEAIIRSMVSYASHSGRRLVAEGIESQPIWQRLLELGCEEGQGYEISPPMSEETLSLWLMEWHAGMAISA
nr:EAL domain-containing protein [Craterilacuibacter sp. RT1T]